MGVPGTGPRRSCYSDTGMLAMPLSKVTEILRRYPRERGGTCRDDSVETRVATAEVLVREKPGNYRERTASRVQVRVYGKGGTGNGFGGRLLAGLLPTTTIGVRCAPEERKKRSTREGEKERKTRDRARAPREEKKETERAPEVLSTKIATPRRASRHCRLARSTWGRKVRESTRRCERARRDRKREREKGRETGSLRRREKDGGRASRRVLPRRARSDAARLSRRGKREGGGGGQGRRGGGGKDAHSFLESRGPLLIPKVFPFVEREIRMALDRRRLGLGGDPRGEVGATIDDAGSSRYPAWIERFFQLVAFLFQKFQVVFYLAFYFRQ